MATTNTQDPGRRGEPISELVRSLIGDITLLARREAELARIELKDKASKAGLAAGLLGAGIAVAWFAVATLIATAVLALAIVLPAWAAALIVGLVLVAVAMALVLVGRARLRAVGPLAPTQTIDTVQEDIRWMQLKTEQLKTSE
jgi:hypothetical protein